MNVTTEESTFSGSMRRQSIQFEEHVDIGRTVEDVIDEILS